MTKKTQRITAIAVGVVLVAVMVGLAIWAVKKPSGAKALFPVYIGCQKAGRIMVSTFDFQLFDVEQTAGYDTFVAMLNRVPNLLCPLSDPAVFRILDGRRIAAGGDITLVRDGNLGAVVLPEALVAELGGEQAAFAQMQDYVRKRNGGD